MATFRLLTLGTARLTGPAGPVQFDDPFFVALIVTLALAGREGLSEGELMLLLTPDAKPEQARTELSALVAQARLRLGDGVIDASTPHRYALAADVIDADVEVSDLAGGEARSDFLAGFKLPGSPEFRTWLAAARTRVVARVAPPTLDPLPSPLAEPLPSALAEPRSSTLANARPSTLPRAIWAVATLGVVVVVLATFFAREAPPSPVTGFNAGDPLLLADLRNETGDTLFDKGIITAATIALQQSPHVRMYARSRLAAVYGRMQIPNRDTALSFELAQEVAERDRVRFVLGLELHRTNDGYRVTARLADVEGKQAVTETGEPAESEAGILAALDRVLLTIRQRLGESRVDLRERRRPLPLVTTASMEALRSYAEGGAAWAKADYRLAGELWLRAVDLDTGFAMAHGALGNWYYYHHDRAKGESYFAKALQNPDRLTEWEHLQLQERREGYRGNSDSSTVLTALIASRFPNVSTWYDHGTGLMQADRHDEARAAFRRALSFDSTHVNSWINLATVAKQTGEMEEALSNYARANAADSLALYRGNINHEWGGALVLTGRLAEAESAFRRMSVTPPIGNRMLGLRSMGYLALWQGRFGQSIDFFRQSIDATVQSKSQLSEARNRLLLASVYRIANRDRDANAEVSRSLALMSSPGLEPVFLSTLAFGSLRLGRLADAESVAVVMRSRVDTARKLDRAALAFTQGALALARNYPDSALALLEKAGDLPQAVLRFALIGDAYQLLGRPDSVEASTRRILEQRGFGFEGQDEWLLARRTLGDLLLARGDSTGAAAAYRQFLEQWRDAPRVLPQLVAARQKLALLEGPKR